MPVPFNQSYPQTSIPIFEPHTHHTHLTSKQKAIKSTIIFQWNRNPVERKKRRAPRSLLAMVMAMGKRTTILPEATLRNSGLVRSGLLSLLAVPGLGLLQLTSGTTTSTIGTAIASSSKRPPESPPSNPQPPPPPSSTITVNTIGRCGVNFLFPKGNGLEFHHLDTLNVTYQSSFANPTLHCWCRTEPGSEQVTERESSPL